MRQIAICAQFRLSTSIPKSMVRSRHARRIGRRIDHQPGVRGPTGRARSGRRAAAPASARHDRRPHRLGLHRTARARSLRRHAGRLSGHPRSRPPDGARMRVQRLDDRLLRAAQLDAGAVRRARAGGGVRDATLPRARSPGADGPRRADGRGRPADGPVVVGHRGDARQLDHRRCAVRTGRRHLPRPCVVAHRRHPDRGRLAHRRHARHRLQRRRHHRRVRPRAPAGAGVRHLYGDGAGRRASRRRHLPLADGARPCPAGGHARARQCRTRR